MNSISSPENGRQRVKQLFHFLRALHQTRNPVRRDLKEYPFTLWLRDLPEHPCVYIASYSSREMEEEDNTNVSPSMEAAQGFSDVILRVQRPNPKPAPLPPV